MIYAFLLFFFLLQILCCLRIPVQLFEEAFTIYAKFNHHSEAVEVLLNNMNDIDRALEYATRINDKEVWTILARAQLEANLIKEAIDAYIKATDATNAEAVIRAAEREGKFEDLVRFLEMARATVAKDRSLDSALVYALAQTRRLSELESFVTSPNVADLQVCVCAARLCVCVCVCMRAYGNGGSALLHWAALARRAQFHNRHMLRTRFYAPALLTDTHPRWYLLTAGGRRPML